MSDLPFFCARCGTLLFRGSGSFFVVTIEAVADPTPPIITEEDLARDHVGELRELIEQMSDTSEREMMDQVHRRLTLHLCGPCYRQWIEDPTPAPSAGT